MKSRILYIGNHLSSNGNTTTTIETLSNSLKKEGYQVIISSRKLNKTLRMLDMLFTTFNHRKKIDIVLIDTYSTLNFYYAVAVAKLCRIFKIPYIPILHGGNLPNRLKRSPQWSKSLFSRAKINVAPSHYLLEAFKKEGFTKLIFISNTIEIKNYPFLLRKQIQQPKLLWVRSFSKLYNPLLAIEILEELLKTHPNATLCMVGPEKDGSLKIAKEISEQKKLPITFTGILSKPQWIELSKDYSIFINTTNLDNTPVSIIEAMALGFPIVSSNVGGLPFLIKEDTGVLVTPNQVDGFVKAIIDLINKPNRTRILSINARNEAEKMDWKEVKNEWNAILKK